MNMKKYLPYGVALAILGLAATPLISQTQTTSSSSSSTYIQASKIVGTKVKTQSGEEVGVVKDVVLDRSNGCMAYTVLAAGGGGSRVTGQSKLVAVPWSVYTVSPDASYLTTTIERDRIYNGPVFEYSRIGDPSFTSTVYSTFGVSAGVGYSNTATTTAGVNTQTQTNAQTNATNNPPPPAAGPTNNPSPGASASPSASASATAEPSASASASPSKATRGAKGGMSPVSSPRQNGDEMKGTGTSGESASESKGESSSSGTKSSKSSKRGSSAEKSTSTESSASETGESSSGKKSSHKKSKSTSTEQAAPSPGGEQE
jgi:sporulation protein YlmC with PRC-barrel domain